MNIYEMMLSLFYKILKGDDRYKYYEELKANLNLSRTDIIKIQNKNIKKLINHAYFNTQYYKELMDSHCILPEDINNREDLNKLPALTKQLIKDNIDKITSDDKFSKNLIELTSGGSTGEQAVIYKSSFYDQISRGSWLRNNAMIGWMPSDKTVWIWGSPIEHARIKESLIARLGIFVNRRIILNAFNYSEDDFSKWYNKILKFEPKVVFGYSSIILEFANFLIENKLKLPSVKMVVSTTEKLFKRKIIESAFNCKVHDQYGCREVISIGIELSKNKMVFTDDVVVLNTNEENEFLLTPLFSYGFPLINYKVGDRGKIKNIDEVNSKYPFPEMNLEIGRITDNFINRKHNKISTSALSTYLSTFDLGVKEHQIIQVSYTSFEINFVPYESTNCEAYYKIVRNCLEEYFGNDLWIRFTLVTAFPVEKSGKKLLFKRTFKFEE